jgi:DNA-directed RNA polymerase specialized sigma24 family protein
MDHSLRVIILNSPRKGVWAKGVPLSGSSSPRPKTPHPFKKILDLISRRQKIPKESTMDPWQNTNRENACMPTTPNDELIAQWIEGIRLGDDESATRVWEAFFHKMMAVAQSRLKAANRSAYDEEDLVLSAFRSFCFGVRKGRFPQLRDAEDLWRLLFVITARKVADQFAYQRREKRDSRLLEVESQGFRSLSEFEQLFHSREPSPEFAAECAEQLQDLLTQLQNDDLKQIALMKMEGFKNQEIADQLQRGLATIERKIKTIREIWSHFGK